MKQNKIFLSGPMQGYKNFNFDAFDKIESMLKGKGYEVINPAHISREYMKSVIDKEVIYKKDFDYDGMVNEQIKKLKEECFAIFLLNGWENSSGAKAELKIAIETCKKVMLELNHNL